SDPLDRGSVNLARALNGIAVEPKQFVITFNTILGEAFRQLSVAGHLRDGSTIDLTSRSRGTNYNSSDLNICNFGAADGAIFAGVSGVCSITVISNGFTDTSVGTVTTFSPTPLSFLDLDGPGNSVDVRGDYVFVAAGLAGLEIVSVANRNAPTKT